MRSVVGQASRGMSAPPQRNDGALGRMDDGFDLRRQHLDRAHHFGDVAVPIVALANITTTMTKNALGMINGDASGGHQRSRRSAQIMYSPTSDARRFVEFCLRTAEGCARRDAIAREWVVADARKLGQDRLC